jgi:hypothetical protein
MLRNVWKEKIQTMRSRNRLRLVQRQKQRITFKQAAIASSAFILLLGSAFFAYFNFSNQREAQAAVAGDYRSVATGNWNTTAIWERYNGAAWAAAPAPPSSADGTISIQNGHTVSLTVPVTADQLVVDAGGTLNISAATLTLANGTGSDMIVNGTCTISSGLTLAVLATADINGLAVCKAGGNISFGLTSLINVNGRFRRTGGTVPITVGNWAVNNGGTFEHAINGASLLPTGCWKAGSTCEVTGIINTMPANINAVFHHFIWNCPGQLAGFDFNAKFDWVNGDLTIVSTGASSLQFDYQGNNNTTNIGGNLNIQGGLSYGCANGSALFNIGGNYVQSGGTFAFNQSWANSYGNTSTSLNITGNLLMTGGIMDMTQSTANNAAIGKGHINLTGNINLSGTALITETSADSHGEIVFAGNAIQTYDLNNLVTNKIDYIINPGATVRTNLKLLTSDGDFTLMDAGHIMIGSPDGITKTSMLGNVQVTGTRTYGTGGYYTYEAASAQVSGDGLPAQVANLTLNNANNCTLTNSSSVSGILTFQSGLWIATTDTLTLGISTGTRGTLNRITGHVVGYFRRWLTTITVNDILFPVGTVQYYNGANFSFTVAPTSGGSIVSTFIAQNPGLLGLPKLDAAVLCDGIGNGYWSFGPFNGFAGGKWTVNLYANGFAGITDVPSLHICRRNGAGIAWGFNGTHSPGTGTTDAPVANRVAMSILGHYGITSGSLGNPLPVKLVSFHAVPSDGIVNLDWATAAEINNNYFTLERSNDAHAFSFLAEIKGSGTTSNSHSYVYNDENPLQGKSYYRLLQTDYNGKTENLKTVAVTMSDLNREPESNTKLLIAPNPFNDAFYAEFEWTAGDEVQIILLNSNGATVYSDKMTTEEGENVFHFTAPASFKAGSYFLKITGKTKMVGTGKLICRK